MKTFQEYIIESTDSNYILKAGKTVRPWKVTKTYNVALQFVIKKGDQVLDYGSGKYQFVKPKILALGASYYPYDQYGNIGNKSLLHDKDVVMGSNILNTATYAKNPKQAYYSALKEMVHALKSTGTLVVNMPVDGPRADWMTPKQLEADLNSLFHNVKKYFGEVFVASSLK